MHKYIKNIELNIKSHEAYVLFFKFSCFYLRRIKDIKHTKDTIKGVMYILCSKKQTRHPSIKCIEMWFDDFALIS